MEYITNKRFGSQNHQVGDFWGPQSLVGVPTETGNNMRHHRKSYVEFKQNRNELMAVRCIDEELDHFASRVKWFGIK